jgi:hypothetical protein
LVTSSVPNGCAISHHWDNQSIVYPSPSQHIDASDRIAKYVDATDGGSTTVRHDGGVVVPVELLVDVYAKVSDWFFGVFDVLSTVYWVVVFDPEDRLTHLPRIGSVMGERH